MNDQCKCSFTIRVTGDGCRYCQPQTYIDTLEMCAAGNLEDIEKLASQRDRALAQLRECADTLGTDQFDEMRASRAYADAMALLAEMPHISRTPAGDAALKEQ